MTDTASPPAVSKSNAGTTPKRKKMQIASDTEDSNDGDEASAPVVATIAVIKPEQEENQNVIEDEKEEPTTTRHEHDSIEQENSAENLRPPIKQEKVVKQGIQLNNENGEVAKKTTVRKRAPPQKKVPVKAETPTNNTNKQPVRKRKRSDEEDGDFSPVKKLKIKAPSKNTATKTKPSTQVKEETIENGQQDDVAMEEREETKSSRRSSTRRTPKKEVPTPKKKTPKKEEDESEDEEKSRKKKPRRSSSKQTNEEGDEKKEKKKGRKKKEEDEHTGRKWWEEDENWRVGKKKHWKWRSLEHNGVYFTPSYVAHGVKMLYNGKEVDLTPDQEEWATYFARYLETDHMQKPQFSSNFFKEWQVVLGDDHVIQEYKYCDFGPIHKHVKEEQEKRKNRTKEEKEVEKKEKAAIKDKHGYAVIDGHREAIGNFTVEPPGLFLGRGQHPKAGMFKNRVLPEQVTLNLGEGVDAPKCPLPGHKWGAIVHNHEVTWLACWRENINNQNKYVLFSAQSSLRGRSDRSKFETAKKLKYCIKKIRKDYMKNLKNKEDLGIRQRATAMWVIDHLALRVGNDKSKDEADTVGCCSLRCEHVKLHEPNQIEFDFLGKDSMRYHNQVEVILDVFKNFKIFMKGKSPEDQIFDRLNPPQLNAHLQSLMDGLTAKVFRTYNASYTMQQELNKFTDTDASMEEKVLFFNSCSVQVAVLCNHQRSVPKTFQNQIQKIDEQIEDSKEEIKELKDHIKRLKAGKEPKKRKSKDDEEEKKPFSTNIDVCERKIVALEDRIRKLDIKKKEKDTLKEVSTSTSKVNYIDPRISIAWCKKNGVDIKKIFAKTMRDKFAWALAEVDSKPDFEF